jgi:hypothetical protein
MIKIQKINPFVILLGLPKKKGLDGIFFKKNFVESIFSARFATVRSVRWKKWVESGLTSRWQPSFIFFNSFPVPMQNPFNFTSVQSVILSVIVVETPLCLSFSL